MKFVLAFWFLGIFIYQIKYKVAGTFVQLSNSFAASKQE